ncbi:Predicted arabinose efflux permease, MFS family [Pseudomonas chlororaphis]|uniref:MFS transporter n=1 Tax=Pseudomonas chlororaphis TaxID=587753 RepID=UPI00087BCA1D|nr:MFS transporter [Pseudomonas chlororaphis]AZD69412.1 L-Proline/Glycine betaine transporter ProP [Pseudomonas chlororaphis subsp. aurantiaca]QIT25248.1 MFS transporter [Pseudomonas chlororaphis subsp. aurantiaca]WDH03359.1 MFS transporter [Pseudomonas chlororaphis]WDH07793.1 MFS transporter [Pseudomonas chlororaphis]SDS24632.1 Predicted arabinose efflux permease, MFS family [Pseudomonas chlororaphis]
MSFTPDARPAPFSRSDYKTLGLAALGGALEIYDFIIFVFFALTLSQLFFPPEMPEWLRLLQSFGIFVTGYLARPLGGILMAHFADRLGRKKVFSLSILMMALPCLLIGIMPTYAQIGYFAPLLLLALRVLQGAAVGGEVPSAWVFVAEHAPAGHRGYALGFLQAGLTFGYLIGALTATLLAQLFTPAEILDHAWRYPFLLGGVFGVIGVWLRRWLSETPVFMAMQEQRDSAVELPLRTVLREHRLALLPAAILTCVLTSAVVVFVVITPTMMQKTFGMSASHTFALSSLGIVFLNIGCVLAGLVVDRIGAWRTVMLYSLLLPLGIGLLYGCLISGGDWVGLAYAIAGLGCGVVGAVPSVMVGLFPARIRVSGISFTYNIAYALWASTTPLLLIGLMPWSPWICVMYCAVMGAVGVISAGYFGARMPKLTGNAVTGVCAGS